jgi:signal transduction histidine kinase
VSKLRLLLLEDSELDAELILAALTEGGIDFESVRVQTRADFTAALTGHCPDLILADFSLPSFDGLSALHITQEKCPEVPFLFVSGAIGEERAIETLKSGATDYVLKQRLERLVPSVRRALREAHDRAERKRLEEELRRRAEELLEADRRKDEFLAMLSHELRNPLAPVRNALQLMRLRGTNDPILSQALDIITRQVQHMAQLIEDLLDVTRVTRGKIQLRKERLVLAEPVVHAAEAVRSLMEKRRHHFVVTLPEEPLILEADPVRLEQILVNLLTNAAKYTDPGGRIDLSVARQDSQAVIRVRDTGVGIKPEMQAHIFDLFMQVEHTLDRSEGGLGIGLTLVHRLIGLHGGTIEVASDGPGRGSEFIVRLPACTEGDLGRSEDRAASSSAGLVETAAEARRILIVDDNRDGAESLAMMLGLWGHEVSIAYDGATALRLANSERPELVFLDIGLPEMDGYTVAQRLRAAPETNGLVLVALTGYGQDEDRRRSERAGFNLHLVKPLDPEVVQELLARSLADLRKATPTLASRGRPRAKDSLT